MSDNLINLEQQDLSIANIYYDTEYTNYNEYSKTKIRQYDFYINFRTGELKGNFDRELPTISRDVLEWKKDTGNGASLNLFNFFNYNNGINDPVSFYVDIKEANLMSVKEAILTYLNTKLNAEQFAGILQGCENLKFEHGKDDNKIADLTSKFQNGELVVHHLFAYAEKYQCFGKIRYDFPDIVEVSLILE